MQGLHHAKPYQVRIACDATTRADHACVPKMSCWSRPVNRDGQPVLEPCANVVPGDIDTTADELWQHGRQEEMVQQQLNNAMLGQARPMLCFSLLNALLLLGEFRVKECKDCLLKFVYSVSCNGLQLSGCSWPVASPVAS